ncbi:SHOCT domain-containing protein [Leucobacter chromiiresistens]
MSDSSQSMAQKARGVGNITLQARRASGDEKVTLQDISNFREGVNIINRVSDEARHSHSLRERTSHSTVSYNGQPQHLTQPATVSPAPQASGAGDLNSELERLAALKAQGVLDDEEFTAAKRKLLGL